MLLRLEESTLEQKRSDDQENACRQLWAAVVQKALSDAGLVKRKKKKRVKLSKGKSAKLSSLRCEALNWFKSEDTGIGSFRWIAGILDLEPQRVRARLGLI